MSATISATMSATISATLSTSMSATMCTSMSAAMSATMSATTMSRLVAFWGLRDADRIEIRKSMTYLRTDRLTGVGARDTCVSKKFAITFRKIPTTTKNGLCLNLAQNGNLGSGNCSPKLGFLKEEKWHFLTMYACLLLLHISGLDESSWSNCAAESAVQLQHENNRMKWIWNDSTFTCYWKCFNIFMFNWKWFKIYMFHWKWFKIYTSDWKPPKCKS